jgi:putative nucleotidyltransferase with HDIG domain
MGPVLVFGVSALLLNHVAVALAIGLSERTPPLALTRTVSTRIAGTVLNDLMVLPVALLVAFLYFELWVPGLLVSVLPLLFIRHSYLAKFRLEVANRDLLQVLVKAIETRDPYTSGHSIRVHSLAKRIGEEIGLGVRRADELEAAALLHDIGKIEVVYESILRKEGALSEDEWSVIQSHVDRGVEILTSLSSFNARIIAGIRHHHELYDGTGYPDGLSGEAIPVYARIIKLSDAIDAMLSDRPYRDALSVAMVRSELRDFSGKHFDPRLVDAVLRSSILTEHAAVIQLAPIRSVYAESPAITQTRFGSQSPM